jgi:hypothetical protein
VSHHIVPPVYLQGIRDSEHLTALTQLITEQGVVAGAMLSQMGKPQIFLTGAVVLSAGGVEANSRMRSQYTGPGWDLVKVRGSSYNTGDCFPPCLSMMFVVISEFTLSRSFLKGDWRLSSRAVQTFSCYESFKSSYARKVQDLAGGTPQVGETSSELSSQKYLLVLVPMKVFVT